MKNAILTCLCNAALLVILCTPAQARIVVGMTPTAPLAKIDQSALNQLNSKLAASTGTEIVFRRFDNNAAITNWLIRFQEIDAAIVPSEFIKQQPAGSLKHLVDLHAQSNTSMPLALVVRSNVSNDQLTRTKDALLNIDAHDTGHQLLEKLGVAGVSLPGKPLKRQAATVPPPSSKPVKTSPQATVKGKQPEITQPPSQEKEALSSQEPLETSLASTTTKAPTAKGKSTPAKAEAPKRTTPAAPTVTPDASVPSTKAPQKLSPKSVKIESEPSMPAKQIEAQVPTRTKPQTDLKGKQLEPVAPEPATNKRMVLFVAMVLLLVIFFKIGLFFMRWRDKRELSFKQEETPAIGPEFVHAEVTTPLTTPEVTSTDERVLVEVGQLGSGKVPALLKRCADLPEPVVLQITKGSYEKRVYFAGGQISGALTMDTTSSETEMRWDKLGNLLVREELISSEARDQGIALLKEEPGLRFGEALLKLGLIDLAGLRHALTRQAKVTIYSLILFPEGRYQVFAGDDSLSPEESISLEVISLIREASHHQSEWTAIRQALPNLNKALDFTADGRSKLEKVSLSHQQETTLSLIDGTHTINDICIGSSMMDYEVYRFLYLMVKAGVLT